MMTPAEGVWAPTLTPLTDKLDIDHALLVDHCQRLLGSGCHGIVLFGSTGEAPSFSVSERIAALDALLDGGIARDQIVVGTGCSAFPDTVELTRHATQAEVLGTLVIPPYFYKGVSDVGVAAMYGSLCQVIGSDLSLYLYHFPALSMVPITAGIIRSIRERFPQNLVGLKDSSGQISNLHGFLQDDQLAVLPGTERLMLEGARHGGRGVISATANISAPVIRAVWDRRSDPTVDDSNMLAVRSIIESTGTIPTMKAWLAHATDYPGWNRVRPPLTVLPAESAITGNGRLLELLSVE
ncbi:MAG: dihydrodipicolinate synthase family protein [Acidimicrobiia bacterium]|nr:dihydrodipicolinate synthase family protein [Acidimicrobiia bacterium]